VRSENDIAKFFIAFWKQFIDVFELHHAKVYMAGESYAGQYVPYIANAMIDEQDEKYFAVAGMTLYNPGIGDDIFQFEVPMAAFADANLKRCSL
jgi:carboxypeptidase D